MAAAVSEAGGLGTITAFTFPSPESLRKEIQRARQLTSKPIAVNITLLPSIVPPDHNAYAQVALDEGVRVFETSGNPSPILPILKKNNAVVIHKCVSIKHALRAESLGVDAISIDGFECAGHPGEDDVTSLVLLTRCAQELKIPYIASGGFTDARGAAAALSLGAAAVNMGTRFMITVESPIHQNIKDAAVKASELDTALVLRPLVNTSRIFKNGVAIEVNRIEKEKQGNLKFQDVQELVKGSRGRKVYEDGEVNAGVWSAGQSIGAIKDIPTCKALVDRIEKGVIEIFEQNQSLIKDSARI